MNRRCSELDAAVTAYGPMRVPEALDTENAPIISRRCLCARCCAAAHLPVPPRPQQVASWGMEKADVESLTEAEHAWFLHREELWRRAHVIAADHPGLDPGDVYHALRALELTPSERLRRGLTRVQRRPHTRLSRPARSAQRPWHPVSHRRMGAALLEGASVTTQDIDLWF